MNKYGIDENSESVLVRGGKFRALVDDLLDAVQDHGYPIYGMLDIYFRRHAGEVELAPNGKELEDGSLTFAVQISEVGKPVYLCLDVKPDVEDIYFSVISDAETIYLNPDSSLMFMGMESKVDFNGLDDIFRCLNAALVKNASYMFADNEELRAVPWIRGFGSGELENVKSMFEDCKQLRDISEIEDWNLCNIDTADNLLRGCHVVDDAWRTQFKKTSGRRI